MKYTSSILIASWFAWTLFYHGDLRPSQDPVLWLLGVFSAIHTIVNLMDLIKDLSNKRHKN